MGVALYRSYRPKTLDDVKGQEHITDTLKNALKKGAISHAYLFTGPRGVGKTSIARILAHEINDLKYDDTTHLDIIEIDAASNRRIDEIRELRDKVHIAPTSAKYKVYIIDEVHMLTREAFNALLKTLEEPPEHAVFILATTEAHKVPETIVSRTQRYSFKPIEHEATIEHLRAIAKAEKLDISDDALRLLAEHGRGSFRDSISMLDQIAGFGHDRITKDAVADLLGVPDDEARDELLAAVAQSDSNRLFDALQQLREKGANPSKIAQVLIATLREQLMQNQSVLKAEKAIDLMKELLPLTGTNSSYEALEIALLDSLVFSEEEAQEIIDELEDKHSEEERVRGQVDVAQEAPAEKPSKPTSQQAGSWNDVLQALKENNNTLYGILRMADASMNDDMITLTFKFEFHRKQLNQPKNLETLHDIIEQSLGKRHQLELQVNKSVEPQPIETEAETKDDNDTLKSVSNIFGDAELLES